MVKLVLCLTIYFNSHLDSPDDGKKELQTFIPSHVGQLQNTQQHEQNSDAYHIDIKNESIGEGTETSVEQLSVLASYRKEGKNKKVVIV